MRLDAALCAVRPLAAYGVDLMSKVFRFLIGRLGEASTWKGIFLILTATGISVNPDMQAAILSLGLSVVGAIGVATPDPETPQPE
jgi:hypothetical protein